MASHRFHERWLAPACTSALLAAFLLLVMLSLLPGVPGGAAAFCLVLTAPLFLIAVVFVGKLSLDFGLSDESRGELEQLIAKKQRGELHPEPPEIWEGTAHIVGVMILPARKSGVSTVPAGEMLERLLDWKHAHGVTPTEWDEPAPSSDAFAARSTKVF